MRSAIRNLWLETQGQDLLEYALAAGMVAVAAVAVVPPLSAAVNKVFNQIGALITTNIP